MGKEVEEALVPCRLQRGSHPEVGTEGMTANHSLNLLRMMVWMVNTILSFGSHEQMFKGEGSLDIWNFLPNIQKK